MLPPAPITVARVQADLASRVRSLHAGGSPMSPLLARQLLVRWRMLERATPVPAGAPRDMLSPREPKVPGRVARGSTCRKAALCMRLSRTSVRTHGRSICGKPGVHHKTQAVCQARQPGLLP